MTLISPERIRLFKDRLSALARHPKGVYALFLVALVEASIFPLPPDLILIPLILVRPERTFMIASACIAGSVTGAMLGYLIGATLFEAVGGKVIALLGVSAAFDHVLGLYRENALWTLLLAGFTSIPFSVFTIAAGFHRTLAPLTLLSGAILGRSVRFFLLAGVLKAGGPTVKRLLQNHLPALSLALLALLIAGVVLVKIFG